MIIFNHSTYRRGIRGSDIELDFAKKKGLRRLISCFINSNAIEPLNSKIVKVSVIVVIGKIGGMRFDISPTRNLSSVFG